MLLFVVVVLFCFFAYGSVFVVIYFILNIINHNENVYV